MRLYNISMRKFIAAFSVIVLLLSSLVGVTYARPSDFCERHPTHCVSPTPSATLVPTASPTATPTSRVTPSPTPTIGATSSPTATPTASQGGPNPLTCTGYPEPRIYIESQAWWSETTDLNPPSIVGEHIHAGMCWPRYGTIVRNSLHVDLHILVHEGDSSLRHFLERMRVNWRPVGTESGGGLLIDNQTANRWDVPLDSNGNGERIFGLDLNLSSLGSATRRIRFNPMAAVPGDTGETGAHRMYPGPELWLCVNICSVSTPHTVGKGWYVDHGYQNASLNSMIPTAAVHGDYCFNININPGGGGLATVEHIVAVDPNVHMGSLGNLILRGTGTFSGNICIHTTQYTNGTHKIMILGRDHQLAGVLVWPIVVAN